MKRTFCVALSCPVLSRTGAPPGAQHWGEIHPGAVGACPARAALPRNSAAITGMDLAPGRDRGLGLSHGRISSPISFTGQQGSNSHCWAGCGTGLAQNRLRRESNNCQVRKMFRDFFFGHLRKAKSDLRVKQESSLGAGMG